MLIALQSAALQTKIALRLVHSLTKNFDGRVETGQVCYVFFNDLIVKDFNVITRDNDTLVSCRKLSVRFSAKNLLSGKLRFRSIYLSEGLFKLVVYPDSQPQSQECSEELPKPENRYFEQTDLFPDLRIRKPENGEDLLYIQIF